LEEEGRGSPGANLCINPDKWEKGGKKKSRKGEKRKRRRPIVAAISRIRREGKKGKTKGRHAQGRLAAGGRGKKKGVNVNAVCETSLSTTPKKKPGEKRKVSVHASRPEGGRKSGREKRGENEEERIGFAIVPSPSLRLGGGGGGGREGG